MKILNAYTYILEMTDVRQKMTEFFSWFDNETHSTIVVMVLVGVTSFGLGRMSMTVEDTPETGENRSTHAAVITPEVAAVAPSADTQAAPATGDFVASRNGTKYHALPCPGAKQINEANKIFFASEQEAAAAGYTRAANCPD